MRTYQRLVIARGDALPASAYPHNFIILDDKTGTLKIGSTKVRYEDLPQTMSGHVPMNADPLDGPHEEQNVEQGTPNEIAWPPRKKARRRKVDDSPEVSDDI